MLIFHWYWSKVTTTNINLFHGKLKTENSFYMEIKPLDLLIGLILGAALGVGATLLVIRIRGWLGKSEVGRLRSENRVLSRRLAEKDRHIGRMLTETQRLAERLGKTKDQGSGARDQGLEKLLSSDP
jgi:hypothetical protein